MSNVELVPMGVYQTHQYVSFIRECRTLIDAGLGTHIYFDAARLKWGLDSDSAQCAIYEAEAHRDAA